MQKTFKAILGRAQLFDGSPGPDGKIRTSVWDRFCTMGQKVKEGEESVFSAETLGQMIENWYARGGRLAMCQDHKSAATPYVSAPALAFYDAMAVVEGGRVVLFRKLADSAATEPDIAALGEAVQRFATEENPDPSPDGLWGFRCEITPLGEDAKEGLRNYRGISPMFVTDGHDEQENPIGYVLFDVAATNTAFQAGCEITFNRGSGDRERRPRPQAMAVSVADVERVAQSVEGCQQVLWYGFGRAFAFYATEVAARAAAAAFERAGFGCVKVDFVPGDRREDGTTGPSHWQVGGEPPAAMAFSFNESGPRVGDAVITSGRVGDKWNCTTASVAAVNSDGSVTITRPAWGTKVVRAEDLVKVTPLEFGAQAMGALPQLTPEQQLAYEKWLGDRRDSDQNLAHWITEVQTEWPELARGVKRPPTYSAASRHKLPSSPVSRTTFAGDVDTVRAPKYKPGDTVWVPGEDNPLTIIERIREGDTGELRDGKWVKDWLYRVRDAKGRESRLWLSRATTVMGQTTIYPHGDQVLIEYPDGSSASVENDFNVISDALASRRISARGDVLWSGRLVTRGGRTKLVPYARSPGRQRRVRMAMPHDEVLVRDYREWCREKGYHVDDVGALDYFCEERGLGSDGFNSIAAAVNVKPLQAPDDWKTMARPARTMGWRDEMKCPFAECASRGPFRSKQALEGHLRDYHGLLSAEIAADASMLPSRPLGSMSRSITAAASGNKGVAMKKILQKLGLAEDAPLAERMARYSAHAFAASPDEAAEMAADLEASGDAQAAAMAKKLRRFTDEEPAAPGTETGMAALARKLGIDGAAPDQIHEALGRFAQGCKAKFAEVMDDPAEVAKIMDDVNGVLEHSGADHMDAYAAQFEGLKRLAQHLKRFAGEPTDTTTMGDDPEGDAIIHAFARRRGIDVRRTPRAVILGAMAAEGGADQATVDSRVQAALAAEKLRHEKQANERRAEELFDVAVKGGFSKEAKNGFMAMARASIADAEHFVASLPGAKALTRLTVGGAPAGATNGVTPQPGLRPGGADDPRVNVELADRAQRLVEKAKTDPQTMSRLTKIAGTNAHPGMLLAAAQKIVSDEAPEIVEWAQPSVSPLLGLT